LPSHVLDPVLEQLRAASDRLDYNVARAILSETVKEYVPNGNIDDLIWAQKTWTAANTPTPTVVDFPKRDV